MLGKEGWIMAYWRGCQPCTRRHCPSKNGWQHPSWYKVDWTRFSISTSWRSSFDWWTRIYFQGDWSSFRKCFIGLEEYVVLINHCHLWIGKWCGRIYWNENCNWKSIVISFWSSWRRGRHTSQSNAWRFWRETLLCDHGNLFHCLDNELW